MANFVMTDVARFPDGTSITVYPAEQVITGLAPSGSSVETGTMTSKGVVFTGLEENLEYVAYAQVSGAHRYQRFVIEPRVSANLNPAGLWDRLSQMETVVSRFLEPSEEMQLLHDAANVLTEDMPGTDSRTYPYGLRRSAEWRWDTDATELVTDDLSRQAFQGMVLTPDDSTGGAGPERFNATSAGMSLEYLGMLAQFEQASYPSKLISDVKRFADVILQYQTPDDPTLARRGGFRLAPSDTTTFSFATANCGLGMLEAWRATQDPRYLLSAERAADYLMIMADPNAEYTALHGVSPLNRVANGYTWAGFLDSINNSDKVTVTSGMINARACELLYQLDPIFPEKGYWEVGEPALNFMMLSAEEAYDSFEPSGNVDATWVTVGDSNDAEFHFANDVTGNRGTDAIEYLLAAALRCGFDRQAIYDSYAHWRDLPFITPDSTFGQSYEANGRGAMCLTGFMLEDGANTSYWDTQGAGTWLELKAVLDRPAYDLSVGKIIPIGVRLGTIVDADFKLIPSNSSFSDYVYATSGVIVRTQCAGGLLRAMRYFRTGVI